MPESSAFIRYDRNRVKIWNWQAEAHCIAWIFTRGLGGFDYPRERGIFDIAISGGVPVKVPASAFARLDRASADLRQAVILFDADEVAAWDVRKDPGSILFAIQKALLADDSAPRRIKVRGADVD